ncbi:iron-sulfur cluster-binding domain-containing protein [Rheinheimera sp.]|uniref:iron-sulfur cluster-binding domain-containing protein n=1 Tax=Rheinheimera sp. TaxID=1869214 RepID=UPI002FDEB792
MVAALAVLILLIVPSVWCCWLTWRHLRFLAAEKQQKKRLHLKVLRLKRQQHYLLITLAHPEGRPLPRAKAGQHLLLYYDDLQGKPVSRAYSLANDCHHRHFYQLAIKCEKNGRLSQSIFQKLKQGDLLCTSYPKGHFLLQNSNKPLVLIAAGVGITPMLAMAYQAIRQQRLWLPGNLLKRPLSKRHMPKRPMPKRKITLVHQCRDASQLLYHRLLQRLPGLNYVPVLSQPDAGWTGKSGRVDMQYLLQLGGKDGHYFCCASAAMTEQLAADFNAAGITHFSYELFSAGISSQSFLISYQQGQQQVHADSAGFATVLDALLASGATIVSDCRGGSCGLCKKRLISGQCKQVLETAASCRDDEVLTCCIQPLSDLTLLDAAN